MTPKKEYIPSIEVVGGGPPVVIINGGPGLSKSYITEGLRFLGRHYKCIFYDQPGCGLDRTPPDSVSADSTADHLVALITEVDAIGPVDIITHSWGNHVLMRAFARHSKMDSIGKVIMLNPTPTKAALLEQAGAALAARLAPRELEMISELMKDGSAEAGRTIMKMALCAYTGSPERQPSLEFDYSIPTFVSVASSLGQFDLSGTLGSFSGRLSVVLGGADYIESRLVQDILSVATNRRVIDGVGHFPFAERPREFQLAMSEILG